MVRFIVAASELFLVLSCMYEPPACAVSTGLLTMLTTRADILPVPDRRDSRTAHGSSPGRQQADSAGVVPEPPYQTAGKGAGLPQLFRVCCYVCMAPRSVASDTVLRQRRELLAAGDGTGAWCAHMEPWGAGRAAEMLAKEKARGETVVFAPPRLDPSTLTPEQWALV